MMKILWLTKPNHVDIVEEDIDIAKNLISYIGQKFKNERKVVEFYNSYAKLTYFDTWVHDSRKD